MHPKDIKAERDSKVITSNDTDEIFNFYNSNLGDYIIPKNGLLQECKNSNAVSIILKHLRIIPNWQNKQNDSEFILRALTFIENLGINKKDNVIKKNVLIEVFKELFNISDEDMTTVLNIAEFLLAKKLVKKIKRIKRVIRFVKLNLIPTFLW
jgi:hypothetical protein